MFGDQKLYKFGIAGIVPTPRIKRTYHLYQKMELRQNKPPPPQKKIAQLFFFFQFCPTNNFLGVPQYIIRYY